MNMWKYYLGKKDFDAAVDHAAIPHIMKSKNLPATDRIIRLLEALSFLTFHLYYVKGKDMILCDFLSRIQVDQGDPIDLVPITYTCYAILQEAYKVPEENYLILTRSQRAQAGLPAPPKVHGASKGVNPDLKPETQARKQTFQGPSQAPPSHPCFVSALLRAQRNSFDHPNKNTPSKSLHRSQAPLTSQVSTSQDRSTGSNTTGSSSDLPATFDPRPPVPDQRIQVRQPQQQILTSTPSGTVTSKQIKTPINIAEIEAPCELDPQLEIPFHETSVEAMFAPPDLKDFSGPPSLGQLSQNKKIIAQNMPRQTEIENLIKHVNRKILRETRLPSCMKDFEAAYNCSSAFSDVYQFLKYNKLPPNRRLSVKIQTQAQDYFLLGSLLSKHIHSRDKPAEPVLCIPPAKIDSLLDYYHSTLIGGHQGISKTLQTLSSRFYCPRLADYIRAYIVGCLICQLFKNSPRFNKHFEQRHYDVSTPALTNVSMDIKYMPTSQKQYKFLLVILYEVSNFIVTHPMKEISS